MPPKHDELFSLSYMTLRQAIGWLGVLMPLTVRVGGYVFENILSTASISAYYYTGMREVFVTTLVLVGALLACYRTPAKQDAWVGTMAGLAAIGIALFPMNPEFPAVIKASFPNTGSSLCYINRGILGYHVYFVAVFFALAFYMVYFRFTAFTPVHPTPEKLRRNRIYKACGLLMLASFAVIAWLAIAKEGASIFWPETMAVIAFAVAWLVKGQYVLKDQAR